MVTATFLVDVRPRDAAFTPDGALAFVPAEIGGSVSVVDVPRSTVIERIALPAGSRPAGVLLSRDGRTLYVANGRANTVAMIDVATRAVTGTIPVGQRNWGLGLAPDGATLYAANGLSNDVSVIDTATRTVVATIPVGDGAWGIAVGR
jgi:YVTN family beta-propeller protein